METQFLTLKNVHSRYKKIHRLTSLGDDIGKGKALGVTKEKEAGARTCWCLHLTVSLSIQ
jgi:hypothetical protein